MFNYKRFLLRYKATENELEMRAEVTEFIFCNSISRRNIVVKTGFVIVKNVNTLFYTLMNIEKHAVKHKLFLGS